MLHISVACLSDGRDNVTLRAETPLAYEVTAAGLGWKSLSLAEWPNLISVWPPYEHSLQWNRSRNRIPPLLGSRKLYI